MASAKKTPKSSKIKQAKQIGTRKTKASRQSTELKAKKAAAARALAVRMHAAIKVGRKAKTNAPPATANRARSEATAKSTARKKVSVARAVARATTRSDKKGAAARSAKTPRPGTAAAGRRAAGKAVSSRTSRQIATGTQPRQTSAQAKRMASTGSVRRVAAKAAATVGKAGASPNRVAQKPVANKAAAAAILALKRKSPPLGKSGGHANSPSAQPATPASGVAESSTVRVRTNEGSARVAPDGHFKGQGRPLASTPRDSQTVMSGLSRPEAAATLLAAGQPKSGKLGLPGRSVAPAQTPARTANLPRPPFKLSEYVVYPSHGVGQITAIEEQEVAGFTLELFVLSFVKDKMILKVPVTKAASVGMRKLADAGAVKAALDTLAGRARIKRTMWSRRAQEYEAKINSGDLNAIAEVVRDLYRSDTQPEQSYSERQLYEAALDRMAREIIVVQKLTETESLKVIEAHLQKGPRRGKVEDTEVEEPDIEEAA
jgi:CarD family transcriptional regulator